MLATYGLIVSMAPVRTYAQVSCDACPDSSYGYGLRQAPESIVTTSKGRRLIVETVATDLEAVWDLVWGPDDFIWFTQQSGDVSRLDPVSLRITTVGTVPDPGTRWAGLMGLAFHPDFGKQSHIYMAHAYETPSGMQNRIIRSTYSRGGLHEFHTVLDGVPGKGNHNGGRLAVGPDRMLYWTTGDAGDPVAAQDVGVFVGKILRLTLVGQPAPGNPFGNYVWSFGHRNPQGLVFAPGGNVLYSTEHGANGADELNRIEAGGNYGWPLVEGSCETRTLCQQHGIIGPLVEFAPPIGISGIAVYSASEVREWFGSLFVASLSGHSLIRLALDEGGSQVIDKERILDDGYGRLRDVLVGADGFLYVATSNRDAVAPLHGEQPGPRDDRILRVRPLH